MSGRFGVVPPEPQRQTALDVCAPKFERLVFEILNDMWNAGHDAHVYETLRTNERQTWLFGFTRDYDDGDGWRTDSPNIWLTWHGFGLAVDIISDSKQWDAPPEFWLDLGAFTKARGLTWGGEWKKPDHPHIQWFIPGMHVSPSPHAKELCDAGGLPAVWQELRAA